MEYQAEVLTPETGNKAIRGILQVKSYSLEVKDNTGKIYTLPLNNLQIRNGGMNNKFVFFTHDSMPGLCFYTSDLNILKEHAFSGTDILKSIKRKRSGRNVFWILFVILPILFFSTLAILLFRLPGKLSGYLAGKIPPQMEREIGAQLKQSVLAGKKHLDEDEFLNLLRPMTERLEKAVDDTSFHFSYCIVQDTTLNAFALPGGFVVIHSGLIESCESAEELAGVLAHEISHVTERHHIRGLIGNIGWMLLVQGLFGDISGLGAELVAAGTKLGSMKYSRDYEREADRNGIEILMRADINPEGLATFFRKLQDSYAKQEKINEWMSTHPDITERINNVRKSTKVKSDYRPVKIDMQLLRDSVSVMMGKSKE